ncbi:hypothetical protein pb186bvf_009280 [Paramecium bursaria]
MDIILIYDGVYALGTVISFVIYLVTQELDQITLPITIVSIGFFVIWTILRYILKQHLLILGCLMVTNALRTYLFQECITNILIFEILIHTLSFQNNQIKLKYIGVIGYLGVYLGYKFDYEKIFVVLILGVLMIQPKTQQEPFSPQKRFQFPSKTWEPREKDDLKNNISERPGASSQIDLTKPDDDEVKRSFKYIFDLINNPAVMVTIQGKPLAFNKEFQNMMLTDDPVNIQFYLISMRITKLDKITHQLFQKKSERLGLVRQQSMYGGSYKGGQSTTSQAKLISLQELLQVIQKDKQQARIIGYISDQFSNNYQIDITCKEGKTFYLLFTHIFERDQYILKDNTKNLMNQLFRSFSHEFSTSLNVIRILAENGIEELDQFTVNQYIQPISHSCQILNSIVQDIRDYSMIISKQFILSLYPTNLYLLIKEVATLFAYQIYKKGLELKVYGEDITITTDHQRIKQCLVQLLSNAQKFTEKVFIIQNTYFLKGSIIISTITKSSAYTDTRYVEISVEDTGYGMNEEEQRQIKAILESDHKIPVKNRQDRSYGIGLMIGNRVARGLCRDSNSGFNFTTKEGQGSRFWFNVQDITEPPNDLQSKVTVRYEIGRAHKPTIKIDSGNTIIYNNPASMSKTIKYNRNGQLVQSVKSEHSEEISDYADEKQDSQIIIAPSTFFIDQIRKPINIASDHDNKGKVLIIDDEFVNIYALQLMLTRLKYKSDYANNGQDGLNKFMQSKYDFILMDIEMPIMNGFVCTQKILQYCKQNRIPEPYIIAQTAYTDSGTQKECRKVGMKNFLSKPISTMELKNLLMNPN